MQNTLIIENFAVCTHSIVSMVLNCFDGLNIVTLHCFDLKSLKLLCFYSVQNFVHGDLMIFLLANFIVFGVY